MLEKFATFCQDFVRTLLTEKFKLFRSGFLAGGAISLPFLFHVQGLPIDLIWLFPLKLFMSVTFSFATGIAAKGSADVYNYFKNRKNLINKNKSNDRSKQNEDNRAA